MVAEIVRATGYCQVVRVIRSHFGSSPIPWLGFDLVGVAGLGVSAATSARVAVTTLLRAAVCCPVPLPLVRRRHGHVRMLGLQVLGRTSLLVVAAVFAAAAVLPHAPRPPVRARPARQVACSPRSRL